MSAPNINQITSQFARMSDQQIQQYAAMHKNDPYTMSLALSEMNRRKETRSAQMGQQQQQPKVVDQAIAGMSQGLPEDSGIAQLPTGPMQYADGGIVAFAKGDKVTDSLAQYEQQIRSEAQRQGVDPDMAVRLFRQESSGDKNVVSPKGASGLGQLMLPAAQEMGLSDKERFDPNKNIPASIGYFKKQQNRFGDPEIAAAAYNYGPEATARHLAQNNGQLNRAGLPKETADYLTKLFPVGAAQAQQVTPVSSPQNQPSIYSGPVPTEAGLEALGQRLDVIRAARSAARPPTPRERREDPDAVNRFQALQDLNRSSQKEYEQYAASVGLDKPAFFAVRKGTVAQPSFTTNPIVQKIAKEAAASDGITQLLPAVLETDPYSNEGKNYPAPEDLTKKEKEQVVDVAKEAMPEKKGKGFSGEDWFRLGLGLLGGKSRNFFTDLGDAGKDVMVSRAENKKAERNAVKEQADIDFKMQQIAESKELTPVRAAQFKAYAEQLAGKNQTTLDKGQNMAIAQAMAAYDKQNFNPAPGARDAYLRSIIAQQQAISAAQSGEAAAIPSQVNVDRPPLSTFQG